MKDKPPVNTLTTFCGPNQELRIQSKDIYREDYAPYTMIGKTNDKNTKQKHYTIFEALVNATSSAVLQVFDEMICLRDPDTNMIIMTQWYKYNATKMRAKQKKIVKLRHANLIVKVRQLDILPKVQRYTYMINPYLLKPWKYEEAKIIWDTLKQK